MARDLAVVNGPGKNYPQPVSDLATGILDPLLRRRAGMSVALVQSWDEIAGPRLAGLTRPERIQWPRRTGDEDAHEPGTLIVACAGAAALRLQHETAELVGRVNAFLGYGAISRIRIVQKPVQSDHARRPEPRRLSETETARLDAATAAIDDPGLREALGRLGAGVLRKKSGNR